MAMSELDISNIEIIHKQAGKPLMYDNRDALLWLISEIRDLQCELAAERARREKLEKVLRALRCGEDMLAYLEQNGLRVITEQTSTFGQQDQWKQRIIEQALAAKEGGLEGEHGTE